MLSATFDTKTSHEMYSSGLAFGAFQGQPLETQQFLPPLFDEATPASLQPLPALDTFGHEQVCGFFGVDLSPPPLADFSEESSCLSSQDKLAMPNLCTEEGSLLSLSPVDTKLCLPSSTTCLSVAPSHAVSSTASDSGSASEHTTDSLTEANQTIENLESTVEAMSLRIKELENMVLKQNQKKAVVSSRKSPQSPPVNRRLSVASTPPDSSSPASSSSSKMTLSLAGEMEDQWYCDRPYPSIRFRVMDQATGLPVASPPKFKVELSLLDGYGKVCDRLGGPAAAHGFEFESDKSGFVEVSNIRFTQVSSKMGGHFTLIVKSLSEEVEDYRSGRITVLSYRLFNARKLDFNRLTTSDPLSKVKGIGSLYAKRFATLGIHTVEHLSLLMTEKEEAEGATGPFSCGQVIESLRKVRGALTCQKLEEYVLQARDVVKREQNNPSSASQAQSNKTKRNGRKRGRPSASQTAALFTVETLPCDRPKRQCRAASDNTHDHEHTFVDFVDHPF